MAKIYENMGIIYEDLARFDSSAYYFIENNYRKYPFEELIEREYTMDKIEKAFTNEKNQ